jgi:CDP-2,3-bis-(O-geranylgeranyl)-sn-glycerol synthase
LNLTLTLTVQLLVLLLVANGGPVLARRVLHDRWVWPLDGGRMFFDGKALLGPSKTWRGLLVAIVGCTLVSLFFGFSWQLGLTFGVASMLGDAVSSFAKRRLNVPASGRALGIDQIPEALLPLLACRSMLGLDGWSIVVLVVLFGLSGILISPVMFRLGLRETPY